MVFVRVSVRVHGQLADGRIGGHSEGTCLQPHSLQAMIALVMFSTNSELSAWEIETALSSSSPVPLRSSLASALWHWNLELRRLLNRVDVLEHELSVLHFVGVPNTMNSGTSMFLISPMTWVLAPSVFTSRAVIEVLACSWLCSLRSFCKCRSLLLGMLLHPLWVRSFVSFARVDPCSSFPSHIVVPVLKLLRLSVNDVAPRSR